MLCQWIYYVFQQQKLKYQSRHILLSTDARKLNETHNPNYMETSIIDFFEVLLLWHFEHLKLETCPNYDEQTMGKTLISIYVNVQIWTLKFSNINIFNMDTRLCIYEHFDLILNFEYKCET